MAEAAVEAIKKELTCPLCLDILGDPSKRLPCDHKFCMEPCLQGLILRSQNGTITCPECHTVVQVPQNNVDNLPTAKINCLKEAYNQMQQNEETADSTVKQSKQATCTVHVSQPLAIYCETCEEVLCRDCLLKTNKHKDHDHRFIVEVADKHRQILVTRADTAKEVEEKVSSAVKQVCQEKLKVETQRKSHLDQLDANIDAIVSALMTEKEQLKSSINKMAQEKTNALECQEQELTTCLSELSDAIEQAENSAQNQSDEEIVWNEKKHFESLREACDKLQGLPLQPADKVDHGLSLTSPDEIVACYKQGNYWYPLADPQKCVLERLDTLETGKQCTASLEAREEARDSTGKMHLDVHIQNVQVELLCIRLNTVTYGNITLSATGKSVVSITPESRGRHMLSVIVDHTHIPGSPFSVYVQLPPQQLDQPITTITDSEADKPAGLTCFNGKLYANNFVQITVLNENANKEKTFELQGVNEIAIDAETGAWFITDKDNHQVHKLDENGRHIKSVGSRGDGPDQFEYPNGIQVSRIGEVFVCDTNNHRIKVYDKELCLQRILGGHKVKKVLFNDPANLAIDETGNLFVTEMDNHHIHVLSPDGKTICTIGKPGSKPGELNTPIGIAINGQYIYIADCYNSRISVFTTQGVFVTTFGSGILVRPECIAIDRDGYVYVSENREKICIF